MAQKFTTLGDAIALAEFAHRNQIDKSGQPYIKHPLRVMEKVQAQGALPFVQMAAVLHDVTEDTRFTPQMLLDLGLSEATVTVVKLVDRHESYELFKSHNEARDIGGSLKGRVWYTALGPDGEDEFYYERIRNNPFALQVKLADIEDNLSVWRLNYLSIETQERLKAKYAKALAMLGVS